MDTTRSPRTQAFEAALAAGYRALSGGDFKTAYARFEDAHVLGQERTLQHVRSHVAFARWAWRARDAREALGQALRIVAAVLVTWLWVPRGNTGGANVSAIRPMPVRPELDRLIRQT